MHARKYGYVIFCLVLGLLAAQAASAQVQFSVSASSDKSYSDIQVASEDTLSASVALGLGPFMRVSYTLLQKIDKQDNLTLKDSSGQLGITSAHSESTERTNAVDLSLIVYPGEVFVPFIFGGIGRKEVTTLYRLGDEPPENRKLPPQMVPRYGIGLGIQLSRRFGLKGTYTLSPVTYQYAGLPAQHSLDVMWDAGLTYTL